MKISIVTMILTAFLSCFAYADELKPTNWQPVYGVHYPGGKVYFDANNIQKSEDSPFVTGALLLTLNSEGEINTGKKVVQVRSVIKILVMSCANGQTHSVFDIYFDTPMPTTTDKPITVFKYSSNGTGNRFTIPGDHPFYKAFCPKYY